MAKALAPIQRESISALVGEELRRGILDGRFAPGAQIGEAQLAEQFAVSRGPVREAMARLVQEGLLVSEPRRGVFVRRLTPADVPDLYFAREAIETAAAVRVAGEQPAQQLGGLERLIERMAAAADKGRWNELAELDLRFHESVVDAAGSERLSRLFRTLAAETRLCLNALEGTYRQPTDVVDEHRELLVAICSSDERRVRATFERHLREAVANLLAAP
jgi:DNA-binding GntR family transcriptional regulator